MAAETETTPSRLGRRVKFHAERYPYTLGTRISRAQLERLEHYCHAKSQTPSQWVRELIEQLPIPSGEDREEP